MKIHWNKINRGLVLGLALLIFLSCFIVFKQKQFDKEKPLITSTVKSYLSDLAALNVFPDGSAPELGKELTQEQRNAQIARLDALLNKYWEGNKSVKEIKNSSMESVRENYITEYLTLPVTDIIHSATVTESKLTVTSDGPDRARVELSNGEIIVEFTGLKCSGFYFQQYFYDYYYDYEIEYYDAGKEKVIEPSADPFQLIPAKQRATFYLDVEMEMERVGGEWKIISIYSSVWTRQIDIIEEVKK